MKVQEESEKVGLKCHIQKTKIMASGPITSWQIDGETMVAETLFWGDSKITADGDCSHEIKRHLLLGRKAMNKVDSILKGKDTTLLTKVRLVKAMVFSSSHVCMWELDYKESWVLKNWSFWTVILEKIRVPWAARRSNQQSERKSVLNIHWKDWYWSWKSNTLATWCEEPTHWKRPGAGKDWRQDEKGTTGDEMVGWHHQLDGHEFEQAPGAGDEQGSLGSCSPWSRNELDMIKRLYWTELMLWRRNGNLFQYSYLENLTDRGAWWATVHEVARVRYNLATKPIGVCPGERGRWNSQVIKSINLSKSQVQKCPLIIESCLYCSWPSPSPFRPP